MLTTTASSRDTYEAKSGTAPGVAAGASVTAAAKVIDHSAKSKPRARAIPNWRRGFASGHIREVSVEHERSLLRRINVEVRSPSRPESSVGNLGSRDKLDESLSNPLLPGRLRVDQGTITAAPCKRPQRRSSSASFADSRL